MLPSGTCLFVSGAFFLFGFISPAYGQRFDFSPHGYDCLVSFSLDLRHRWTGRYEAHLWDNSCKNEGQTRKGRQFYLGGYDLEEKAARAYDLAALKYWGPSTHINSPWENYQTELEEMKNMTRQEYVAHLRRRSSGFSRGASIYRGVTRHHQNGRWQARIGRVAGNKDLYLGTFSTQEDAAEAYDVAAIKFRGTNAVTNFEISRYDVEKIKASNTLLAGDLARRNKENVTNVKTIEYHPISAQSNEKITHPEVENRNDSNWNMLQISYSKEQQKLGDFHNFSQIGVDDLAEYGTTAHFYDPSSLVTSLSSSREVTPDMAGSTVLITLPVFSAQSQDHYLDGSFSGVHWID